MSRKPQQIGRWSNSGLRLDIIRELKMLAIKEGITFADMVNRALWLGLQAIRSGERPPKDPESAGVEMIGPGAHPQ